MDRESRGEKDSDQARGAPSSSFDSQVRCVPLPWPSPNPNPNPSPSPSPNPNPNPNPNQDPDTTNLYVGNMSPDITEEFLYKQFCDFGPVQSVKVC